MRLVWLIALSLGGLLACGPGSIDLDGARERLLVSEGDSARLRWHLARAARGETVTLGAIGGSITVGYKASTPERSWLQRTARWWRGQFPGRVEVINAGVGATGSDYGALRAERDLLATKPDVVFVDFAVNDPSDREAMETYEGLCRRSSPSLRGQRWC